MKKEKVLEAINKLPEEFSMDELLDELLLIQKIENGKKQSDKDEVTSDDQLDEELPEWLK
jgi:hypothetical protein